MFETNKKAFKFNYFANDDLKMKIHLQLDYVLQHDLK